MPLLAGGCADLPHGMLLQIPSGAWPPFLRILQQESPSVGQGGEVGPARGSAHSTHTWAALLGTSRPFSHRGAGGKCKIHCRRKEREEFISPNSPNLLITLFCLHFV